MCYAIIIPEKDSVFMKRNAMQSLINWKNDPERKPLILRGARQVQGQLKALGQSPQGVERFRAVYEELRI